MTLLLIAIVLPAIMQGISLATTTASLARRRTEAAGLAQSKISELLATSQWQNGAAGGDFGTDWPDYRWDETVAPWQGDTTGAGIQQIDVKVTWTASGRDDSLTVSSLAYPRNTQQQSQ